MAQFLTTKKASATLEDLALHARKRLVLINPYVQLSTSLEGRFREAVRRRVEIVVVCRRESLRLNEEEKLRRLGTVRLFFMEDVHAKCFCNEDHMVIGSLNLYEFSEHNNREMGVLLSRDADAEAFAAALREVESIITDASENRTATSAREPKATVRANRRAAPERRGHCIRCATDLAYRPEKPLCRDCYPLWAAWGNEDYEEQFCHGCGDPQRTSMAKPLCTRCFRVESSPRKPARL